ncbi:uncharacterized protein VP01_1914g2 [Puccinia sorghi]|uniref:Uncharacterized protein n=1 Tax=Puccinia sorghi TaxID=27349 RepID=A0A0L6VCP6_9BASI|nr:uncharacterized protein VP01_1914g2 [Puccinia sorghi]
MHQVTQCLPLVFNITEGEMTLGRMDITHLVDPPDGCNINLQTIISPIHGLATQGVTPQNQACMLILDARTCSNSMYNMLQQALQLRGACKTYCGSSGKPSQYPLSDAEWDKVAKISKFLAPLNDVTKIICRSKFPTLSMALPIYLSLIKTIYQIRAKYNVVQLIPAADDMIIKLKKYLVLALEKPVPICSMILDPQIKLKHLKKNQAFLEEHNTTTLTQNATVRGTSKDDLPKRSPRLSVIEANIFGEETFANDLGAEINQRSIPPCH